jgi:hypothetical protein
MQMADGNSDLERVELGSVFGESGAVPQVHEELTSSDESHHEEDLLFRLEHVMHSHKEGVVSLHQDVLFQLCALNLIVVKDHIFPQRLHGVDL